MKDKLLFILHTNGTKNQLPISQDKLIQESRRQKGRKAEGRRQKAEGRKQKAEGRKQKAEGRR